MRVLRTIVKRILALVMISFFGFLGIALLCLEPVSILTCRYVETAQVDCQLQERIVGVIPVGEIPITRLKEAYVDLEYQTREDEDGKEYTVSISTLAIFALLSTFRSIGHHPGATYCVFLSTHYYIW